MANEWYLPGAQETLNGGIDWDTDDIRVVAVDSADYTFSSAHDFLDDIAGAGRIFTEALASESITNGTFDAADVTSTSVSGDQFELLVIYKHTGVETTSNLLIKIDTASAGLPMTPNGGDITITWNASGIVVIP